MSAGRSCFSCTTFGTICLVVVLSLLKKNAHHKIQIKQDIKKKAKVLPISKSRRQ